METQIKNSMNWSYLYQPSEHTDTKEQGEEKWPSAEFEMMFF